MKLRRYESKDLPEIADLFRETILTVNCRDYSQEQVEVWAKRWQNLLRRDEWFLRLFTLVAEQDGKSSAMETSMKAVIWITCMFIGITSGRELQRHSAKLWRFIQTAM